MNISDIISKSFFIGIALFMFSSCDDLSESEEIPHAPYVLTLGITANGVTTYYVVTADDLMSGNINAIGKGLEQSGYRDYELGDNTVFSVGGLGVNYVTGISRDANGYLQEKGDFVFNSQLSAFTQVDNSTMLGMEIPSRLEDGDQILFYMVDIHNVAITKTITSPIAPIAQMEWPSITGLCCSDDKVYITYIQMNPSTYETQYTDTTYVAVYSYPDMALETVMKDTRTGPAGSWSAHNGILKTETGDMYIMSNSSIANGFSQETKRAAFLHIKNGETIFDESYFFDFESKSGGLKPAHIKYIGNGLVFAEVSTLNPQTSNDRWSDKNLKCSIIDLYNQTIRDIAEIPIHNGNGGRRYTAMVDGGYVYYPVPTPDGMYIYRIDPQTATAERGAKIATTFIGGLFKLN
jgi:hypothetical protein